MKTASGLSDARRRPTGIRTRYKRCNAAEGDVARRLGIVVGREDGGKLPCKGSAPVFHSHRKCWDIASRRKTALLAGSGASAALAIGERFDLPGFIMDFTSLLPNKSPEPTAVGAFQFRCRGSRRESAVAQLSTLDPITHSL